MPRYLIIDLRKGSMLELNTKKRNFLKMLADARDYLSLPKKQQEKMMKLLKENHG